MAMLNSGFSEAQTINALKKAWIAYSISDKNNDLAVLCCYYQIRAWAWKDCFRPFRAENASILIRLSEHIMHVAYHFDKPFNAGHRIYINASTNNVKRLNV